MFDSCYSEELFRAAWKRVQGMWQQPWYSHALVRGCGRDTFAHWANKTPGPWHSGTYWRRVLMEAVRRGWVVKEQTEFGYSTFRKIT